MRLNPVIFALAAISCASNAFSQTTASAALASYSCMSSQGQVLRVWTDSQRAVVAVAPGAQAQHLPAFATPLVRQPEASLMQGTAANGGYLIRAEGPAYDLDHVLMVGETRLSCSENSPG